MQNFIRINENDTVVVALQPIAAGTEISVPAGMVGKEARPACKVTALEDIPAGHKMAIRDIK